ncbi:MAG: hypothetical protein HY896_04380 [Deltaproteobacteria bacterium]|nr:hypothetical protein [Deltaproteobacteria bacterium]
MKYAIPTAVVFAGFLIFGRGAAVAESPLFLPKAEKAPSLMTAAEAGSLRKEAEGLKRKGELLKEAANKKYAAAGELRKKAGGFRSESSKKGEALRSKAEETAAISSMLGDMFSIMSSVGGMGGGGFSSNAALASSLTGKMIQGQQASDAKGIMSAQARSGQIAMEAEKKAGPLELRADELENEGNRLMEAHNRLMGIANAKFLLVAADELSRKVDADTRHLERLKESNRGLLMSMSAR